MTSSGNWPAYNKNEKDLDSKIMESFNISGASQKASFIFQQPARKVGKRPQNTLFKPSSSSADWSNLDLKTEEFIAPVIPKSNYNVRSSMPPTEPFQMSGFQQQPNYSNTTNNIPVQGYTGSQAGPTFYQQNLNVQPNSSFNQASFALPSTAVQPNFSYQMTNYPAAPVNERPYYSQSPNIPGSSNDKLAVSNKLPSWMVDPEKIPPLYRRVLEACAMPNSYADTSKLYPIFVSSNLPKDVLGHIWSAANRSTPGQLTFSEVYIALALIALAQKGEMNLSVEYATKLKSPPIPMLQLLPKDGSVPVAPVSTVGTSNMLSGDDDFADFQSVPHVPISSTNLLSTPYNMPANTNCVFPSTSANQSQVPAMSNFQQTIQMPARNSPLNLTPSFPIDDSKTFTNKSKYDVFQESSVTTINEDFSDFQMSHIEKNFNPTRFVLANDNTMKTDSDDFGDFMACTTVQTAPSLDKPHLGTPSFEGPPNVVFKTNDSGNDKYSALRDLLPITTQNNLDNKNDSSANEVTSQQSLEPISTSHEINIEKTTPEFSSGTFAPFTRELDVIKPDSTSVKSLELSYSKPVPNFPADQNTSLEFPEPSLSSVNSDKSEFGNFAWSNIPVPNSTVTRNSDSTGANDGLYDLDEPISPIAQRKFDGNLKQMTSPKSPTPQRFIVPRHISETDSDFGDFSSGPPPLDDHGGHDAVEFDMYQAGNSSLCDFDAFDRYEAAQQLKKKKDQKYIKESGKQETTAFSEILVEQSSTKQSMVLNETVNDASVEAKNSTSMMFSSGSNNDFNIETETSHGDSNFEPFSKYNMDRSEEADIDTTDDRIVVSDINSSNDPVVATSNGPSVQTVEESELDKEGEYMKARMEGTVSTEPLELYLDHWSRCLAICKDIIVSTSDIFAAVDSPSVCHEIVNSTRGKNFISCTSEVYGVARRIRKGMESVSMEDEDLDLTLKEIEISWNNLLGFCPYTPSVHKTPEHCSSSSQKDSNTVGSACGLCLLSTDGDRLVGLECGDRTLNSGVPLSQFVVEFDCTALSEMLFCQASA